MATTLVLVEYYLDELGQYWRSRGRTPILAPGVVIPPDPDPALFPDTGVFPDTGKKLRI